MQQATLVFLYTLHVVFVVTNFAARLGWKYGAQSTLNIHDLGIRTPSCPPLLPVRKLGLTTNK